MDRTHPNEGQGSHPTSGEGKPTIRQIYALAGALCERLGEEWPETRADASELIEWLRIENGHPAPRLEDTPLRPRGRRSRVSGRPRRASWDR